MSFTYIPASKVSAASATVGSQIKQSVILCEDAAAGVAVSVVVADHTLGKAEVHERSRDVWYVLNGTGTFILGGELDKPTQSREGEWRSAAINNGERVEVKPGDIVDIPPGVPHQIETIDSRLEMLIVKISS